MSWVWIINTIWWKQSQCDLEVHSWKHLIAGNALLHVALDSLTVQLDTVLDASAHVKAVLSRRKPSSGHDIEGQEGIRVFKKQVNIN